MNKNKKIFLEAVCILSFGMETNFTQKYDNNKSKKCIDTSFVYYFKY